MKHDWTPRELDEALDGAQDMVRNSTQWAAIKFCRQMIAAQFPNADVLSTMENP